MNKTMAIKYKLNIKALLIILGASIILSVIYNYFSADGIGWIRKPLLVKTVENISEGDDDNLLLGLDLANALALYNQGNATFIDARDQWEYGEGHIKGAINIPEYSFSSSDPRLTELDKNGLFVIYCSGDECETSKRLANEFEKLGYQNTFIFLGGFDLWESSDLPIERKPLDE